MKICLLLFAITLLPSAMEAQTPRQAWVNRYSLAPNKTNQTIDISLAGNSSVIVGGSSASTSGDLDYALIKYSPNGAQLWLTRYDSPTNGNDNMKSMAMDTSGNIAVTGSSKTVKFTQDGNFIWATPYAGRAVAIDTNHVYVTGFSEVDFATAKLRAADGTNIWVRTYDGGVNGTIYNDVSQAIAVDNAGNAYVAGYETWLTDRSGTYLRMRLIKYDPNGIQQWNKIPTSGGVFGIPTAKRVIPDALGNVYILFNSSSEPIYSTSKFNTAGDEVWAYLLDPE